MELIARYGSANFIEKMSQIGFVRTFHYLAGVALALEEVLPVFGVVA
jgi:hypothetical protein